MGARDGPKKQHGPARWPRGITWMEKLGENMIQSLRPGQKLLSIFWPGEDAGALKAGENGCKSITVYFEVGQAARVPWAFVEFEETDSRWNQRYNLAHCEGVAEAKK